MCGIAGVLSKKNRVADDGDGDSRNVVPLVNMMLSCMVNRGPDGAGIAAGGNIVQSRSLEQLQHQNISASSALGHTRLAIVGGTCGEQPFSSCDKRLILEHNGEIYNYKQLRKKLERSHEFKTQTDSEVIVHLLEDHLKNTGSLLEAIRKTVAELDGVYAIAVQDEHTKEIALVRDRIGVRQLYYGENDAVMAFASERKALWAVGIAEPTTRLLPGKAIIISPDGSIQNFAVTELLTAAKVIHKTVKSAVSAYEAALMESMKKRTQDFQRIGIIFSGGIDSVLIAYLAKQMVPEVVCYTGGVKNSHDIVYARQIAEKLGLELRVSELDLDQVEAMIPEIINVIEDTNAGQVEVAIPVYAAVKLAHKDGIKVMFTGQAADELFGGYPWYAKVAEKFGYSKLREHMNEDLSLLYKETLEREDKITMAHSIELREPFLDPKVIEVSMQMPLRLNVRGGHDTLGKHIHRKLAMKLGIPKDIAYRPKEAAQHGSGIHDTIDTIARKNGFDEYSIPSEYLESLKQREKVGSSQRYGYIFGDTRIWIAEPHVQMYLDNVSSNGKKVIEKNVLATSKLKRYSGHSTS